jgi:pyruvate ferredoxin oxidoreductase alpha subunit
LFRPFPAEEMAAVLGGFKAVAVMDRADSIGAQGGPLYLEVKTALYNKDAHPPVVNYVYGLGGREIGPNLIENVVSDLQKIAAGDMKASEGTTFLGVKE